VLGKRRDMRQLWNLKERRALHLVSSIPSRHRMSADRGSETPLRECGREYWKGGVGGWGGGLGVFCFGVWGGGWGLGGSGKIPNGISSDLGKTKMETKPKNQNPKKE